MRRYRIVRRRREALDREKADMRPDHEHLEHKAERAARIQVRHELNAEAQAAAEAAREKVLAAGGVVVRRKKKRKAG